MGTTYGSVTPAGLQTQRITLHFPFKTLSFGTLGISFQVHKIREAMLAYYLSRFVISLALTFDLRSFVFVTILIRFANWSMCLKSII